MPKRTVIVANINLGPNILTAIVAGSWNVTLATVYTRMLTDCIQSAPSVLNALIC